MTQSRTTKHLIRRAVEAAKDAGISVGAVRVLPGGAVEVVAADQTQAVVSATCDEVFGSKT